MTFDGDVLLYPTSEGGNINIVGGQPDMDGGLWTAVFVSIFSGVWWGNAIGEPEEALDDGLDSIDATVTPQARRRVEVIVLSLLQWLITAGAARSIDVAATIPAADRIDFTVTITQPDGSIASRTYALNWSAQMEALA